MDTAALSKTEMLALLDWYRQMGVDCALDETPRDRRTVDAEPAVSEAMPAPPKLSDPPAVVPPDEAAQTARELAAAAADLVALRPIERTYKKSTIKPGCLMVPYAVSARPG